MIGAIEIIFLFTQNVIWSAQRTCWHVMPRASGRPFLWNVRTSFCKRQTDSQCVCHQATVMHDSSVVRLAHFSQVLELCGTYPALRGYSANRTFLGILPTDVRFYPGSAYTQVGVAPSGRGWGAAYETDEVIMHNSQAIDLHDVEVVIAGVKV